MIKELIIIGSIILTFLILLGLFPSYKKVKDKSAFESEGSYNIAIMVASTLLSIAINFLVWGFIF